MKLKIIINLLLVNLNWYLFLSLPVHFQSIGWLGLGLLVMLNLRWSDNQRKEFAPSAEKRSDRGSPVEGTSAGSGGGGYYGGGGGGHQNCGGGGGGGGSSYVGGVDAGETTAGVRSGDGYVAITY